nr:retrovirus-related Pol polyprotein from transposon TNT 1-94 [Tanacetum cinerariifolium]
MELKSTQTSTTTKLPMLKQVDYEIENGNSFKPVAETTTNDVGTSTTHIPGPVTNDEKAQKKNDVKARSMLLMALPNEHLMTFNQYKDAKTLFDVIETRFGFRSLLVSWLSWVYSSHMKRNKSDLDTMSLDDLYNNFKIIEQEVRGTTSTNTSSQNMAFVSSLSLNSTNKVPANFGMGHFARECRVPRNHENRTRNQETTRRTVNVEDTSSKAMVAIDGAGFDWSYMTDDEAPTNMAFMAFSDSETSSVKISKPVKENNGAPIIEDWEPEGENEVKSPPEVERKTVKPSADKVEVDIPKQNKKPARRPVKLLRCTKHKDLGRGRMVNGTNHSRVNHFANTVLKELLTRTGLKPVNSVRPVNLKGNISNLTNFKEFNGGYVAFKEELKVERLLENEQSKLVFFLATKDKTSRILKSFISKIENLEDKKVKIIRCDNETEFKNRVMNELCEEKGIKKEYSIARTPQVPVVKPHFKTHYELFRGRTLALSFMRPFGCHVTILKTLDHLVKFDGKSNEGFFVGYSTNSKSFRVYNTRTRKVEENLHIKFLENKPLIAGTNTNDFAGKRASFDAGQSSMETGPSQDYILMPLWNEGSLFDSSSKDSDGDNKDNNGPSIESEIDNQERPNAENSTKDINIVGPSINTASLNINIASPIVNTVRQSDAFFGVDNDMRSLDGVEVDISNISTTYPVPTTLNTRIHKDHSLDNVIGDIQSSSAFWYERIEEEVYVCQPLVFEDPNYRDKVFKVEKSLYGLHQAPRAWYEALSKYLLDNRFHRGKIDETCSSRDKKGYSACTSKSDGIFISQDKYVDEILRKFKYEDVKIANTLMDKEKALI